MDTFRFVITSFISIFNLYVLLKFSFYYFKYFFKRNHSVLTLDRYDSKYTKTITNKTILLFLLMIIIVFLSFYSLFISNNIGLVLCLTTILTILSYNTIFINEDYILTAFVLIKKSDIDSIDFADKKYYKNNVLIIKNKKGTERKFELGEGCKIAFDNLNFFNYSNLLKNESYDFAFVSLFTK